MLAAVNEICLPRLLRAIVAVGLLIGSQLLTPVARAEPSSQVDTMLEMVNQARELAGLAPLTNDPLLDQLATDRSYDMATREYFSHTTPEGQTVFDTMDQLGLGYRIAAENLARGWSSEQDLVGATFEAFERSPAHLGIILGPTFRQIGVGTAKAGDRTYFALVFLG